MWMVTFPDLKLYEFYLQQNLKQEAYINNQHTWGYFQLDHTVACYLLIREKLPTGYEQVVIKLQMKELNSL
jgi:hypothetical protein